MQLHQGASYISRKDAFLTELIRAGPHAAYFEKKKSSKRKRKKQREGGGRIGIPGRGVADVRTTMGGAFQSQHDETKAQAIGED